MVPQLVQGFLHPRTRGRTGKPQRRQTGGTSVRLAPSEARGRKDGSSRGLSAVPPFRRSAVLPKPVRPGEERIGEPLHTDGGVEAVSAVYHRRVGQRQKLVLDRGQQSGGVAARQIRAAYRTVEQHVSPEDQTVADKAHAPGRVARCEPYLESVVPDPKMLACRELCVRSGRPVQVHADPTAVLGQSVVERPVQPMQVNRGSGGLVYRPHAHDVIDVGVSEPDGPKRPAPPLQFGEKSPRLLARIYDDRLPSGGVRHQVAVLRELTVRNRHHLGTRHRPWPWPRPGSFDRPGISPPRSPRWWR